MKVKLNATVYALKFKDSLTHETPDGDKLTLGPDSVLVVYENGDYDLQQAQEFQMAGHMRIVAAKKGLLTGLYQMTSDEFEVARMDGSTVTLASPSLNSPMSISRSFFDIGFVEAREDDALVNAETSGAIDLVDKMEQIFNRARLESGLPVADWAQQTDMLL